MFNVLQRFLGVEVPPNKVTEIKTESLSSYQILHRDDSMVLYAPQLKSDMKNSKSIFEIVLHRPTTESVNLSYSLYRGITQSDATDKFEAFATRLPMFVQMVKEYFTVPGLQKICDILTENPAWSMAHLVAFFNLLEYLPNPKVVELLDYPDHQKYMTPFQVAIQSKNFDMVKALLSSAKLDHLDYNSNSIFHYAANTTKEMILLLTSQSVINLNHYNLDGYTPLHWACLSNNPDCVSALLCAGADVNISARNVSNTNKKNATASSVAEFLKIPNNTNKLCAQDMKNGGTPLHWASSREVLEALIQRGCYIDSLDFNERTALHVMVAKNRLECIVSLLAHEAECDLRDKDGNTALHIAVEKKLIPIVQCLVVFGCDINMKNKQEKSPRHMVGKEASGTDDDMILYILHSVGAKRCPESSVKCPPGCNFKGTYDGIPPAQPEMCEQRDHIHQVLSTTSSQCDQSYASENSARGGRLLCLDGGGIKGLVLVQMLLEIETLTQTPISHLFDWVAGTSTGGILALGLGAGKTMKQCMCLYLRMKEMAFVGSRPYPSDPLENVLKENLGEFTVMSDIKNPKLMVTALMADRKPVDLHIFRNYVQASEILGIVTPSTNRRVPPPPPEEQLIWRAARATGAAPSYFRAFGRFLDGGLIANNPTLDAMTEIHEYNMALRSVNRKSEAVPLSIVVSLGTGLIPVTELKQIDVFRPDSLWDTAKLASGISAIGNLLVDQATLADGRVVDRARAWCSMIGVPYFRFNPQMSVDLPMDEKTDLALINMMWETKAYMYQNRKRVFEMINLLK
ncbi:unnamed protein product [Diamesa serratosioi]